ncbi:hypothetical protein MSPP1_000894 [Malassezia sp. CBS 17886]|nr:hypothetical protein MSPP1_000894 [Malassezia sp. CBS 17886]
MDGDPDKPLVLAQDDASVSDISPTEALPPVRPAWFRSVFFQITVLGWCSFLSPGTCAAMAATGGGGQEDVSLVNVANSSSFSVMVAIGLLAPSLMCCTNMRVALAIGTLGYPLYSASLYTHGKYGIRWFVIFGAVISGITAGTFWAVEGAVGITYPERAKQGIYIAYWLMYRVMGQLLGGAINLGLNAKAKEAGSLSSETYIVFIALQCISPAIAMLLSLPKQVQRRDGTPVQYAPERSAWGELKATLRSLVHPKMLLIIPLLFQANFCEAIISTFTGNRFSVRARALASFLSAIVACIANFLLGFFLDRTSITMNLRAKLGFGIVFVLQVGWWIFAIVMMNRYHGVPDSVDWNEDGFSALFAVCMMLQMGYNMTLDVDAN